MQVGQLHWFWWWRLSLDLVIVAVLLSAGSGVEIGRGWNPPRINPLSSSRSDVVLLCTRWEPGPWGYVWKILPSKSQLNGRRQGCACACLLLSVREQMRLGKCMEKQMWEQSGKVSKKRWKQLSKCYFNSPKLPNVWLLNCMMYTLCMRAVIHFSIKSIAWYQSWDTKAS